jgi:hypothetical protein
MGGWPLRSLTEARRRLWRESWNVGVFRGNPGTLLQTGTLPDDVCWLFEGRGESNDADPMLWSDASGLFLFWERFDRDGRSGVIMAGRLEAHPRGWCLDDIRSVPLAAAGHHSYPFVFAYGADVFMIPESATLGRVDLFRARRLPHDWEFAGTLLPDFPGLDPTLIHHDGRFWLFTGRAGAAEHRELHLFHADSMAGPWRRSQAGPIVDSFGHARPAGPLFRHDGSLYRPAQDCRGTYGEAVTIMRVETLTTGQYRETLVARLTPAAWAGYRHGIHTLSCVDDLVAIDAKGFRALKRLGGPLHAAMRRRRRT